MKAFFVYMVTNRSRVVLDTSVTNDLERRICEHKDGTVKGFTKYKLARLVYYENYGDVRAAITREKEIKGWRRERKMRWRGRLIHCGKIWGKSSSTAGCEVPRRLRGSG